MDTDRLNDERLLIDLVLGRCEPGQADALRARMSAEPELQLAHDNIVRALDSALLAGEVDAPADLADRTLRRIAAHKRTEALIAQQAAGRSVRMPTFSLRELVTLAAAIAILATVVVPAFIEGRSRATAGRCAANVGQIGYALQAYAGENNAMLPNASVAPAAWLPGAGEHPKSNSAALFKLVGNKYASPASFQCPAVDASSFQVRQGMTDFPGRQFVSYSYQHAIGASNIRRDDAKLRGVIERMAILADDTPLFRNGQFMPDRINSAGSDNHKAVGQNVLYLDIHVEWHDGARVGVNGDHIFMAGDIQQYRGDETPTSPEDTFLLPAFSNGPANR